ncbi:hypothetical protein PV350_42915 [Streptomyces sp. PA03-6a]|nr:hypothetical protein [Streptomyces sp. PA03-6a]
MTPATARARTAAVLLLPVLALGSVTGCVSVGGAGGVEGRPGALAPGAGSPSVSAEESVPGPTQGPDRSHSGKPSGRPSSSGRPSQSSPPSDRPSTTPPPGDSSPPPSGGGESPEPSPSSAPSVNGAT